MEKLNSTLLQLILLLVGASIGVLLERRADITQLIIVTIIYSLANYLLVVTLRQNTRQKMLDKLDSVLTETEVKYFSRVD